MPKTQSSASFAAHIEALGNRSAVLRLPRRRIGLNFRGLVGYLAEAEALELRRLDIQGTNGTLVCRRLDGQRWTKRWERLL